MDGYGASESPNGASPFPVFPPPYRWRRENGKNRDSCKFPFREISGVLGKPPFRASRALDDGDSVALAGMLTPKVWRDKNGEVRTALDMVSHAVLTACHVQRKRRAMQSVDQSVPSSSGDAHEDMNDDL